MSGWRPPGAGTAAGKCSGSSTSRSRCTNTGAPSSAFLAATSVSTVLAPITVAWLRSSSSRSPGSRSRTPASTTLLGRHGVAQAGVPLAAVRRPGTCRRGSRCRVVLGRVVVAVRVEPQDARVGAVADRGGQRRHGHRAVGRQQHGRIAARRARRRSGRRPRAGSRATRAGPPRSASRAPRRRCRCSAARRRARAPSAARGSRRRAARPGCGRPCGSAALRARRPRVSVPSIAARASRRTPSRPPGCPRW